MVRFVYGLLASLVIFATAVSAAPLDSCGDDSLALRDLSPKAREFLKYARKVEPTGKDSKKLDAKTKDQGSDDDKKSSADKDKDPKSSKGSKSPAAVPAAPHWVVYADTYVSGTNGPPHASDIQGYNVFALSFLLLAGAWDKAYEWTTLTAAERASIKAEYAAAGIKLIVSVFGATDVPTSTGANPTTTANTMAAWVKQYNLDGIDVDYEDFNAFDAQDGSAENWLIAFTNALRVNLPQSDYILTHAPVAPWFSPTKYAGGGYLKVHQQVGSKIDWYNIQFYNQGANEYTTCDSLLNTSSATWANTALFQIIANGVPASKAVIGKPARSAGDATNGYVSPDTLATCLSQAKAKGWNGGAMVWQFPYATESWIATVRSKSWPV